VGAFSREQTVERPDVAGVESAGESDDPVLDLAGAATSNPAPLRRGGVPRRRHNGRDAKTDDYAA
jgi:hypothetical protein